MHRAVYASFGLVGAPLPHRERRRRRLAITSHLLGRPVTTFKDLTDADYDRLRETFIPTWQPGERIDLEQPAMLRLKWLMHHLPEGEAQA